MSAVFSSVLGLALQDGDYISWREMRSFCFMRVRWNRGKITCTIVWGLMRKDCAIIIPYSPSSSGSLKVQDMLLLVKQGPTYRLFLKETLDLLWRKATPSEVRSLYRNSSKQLNTILRITWQTVCRCRWWWLSTLRQVMASKTSHLLCITLRPIEWVIIRQHSIRFAVLF
jgi:hypothetical protein